MRKRAMHVAIRTHKYSKDMRAPVRPLPPVVEESLQLEFQFRKPRTSLPIDTQEALRRLLARQLLDPFPAPHEGRT